MLITIPDILSKDEVRQFREVLDKAESESGSKTAGVQSESIKRNQQMPVSSGEALKLGQYLPQKLSADPVFLSAALPLRILPPMFNRYETEATFGVHVDNAIRLNHLTQERLRTDLSMTVFLSEPDEYDGGELIIEDHYGAQEVKIEAGNMVLYPSSSLHQVVPVTRGARVSSFFWLQSMIRSD